MQVFSPSAAKAKSPGTSTATSTGAAEPDLELSAKHVSVIRLAAGDEAVINEGQVTKAPAPNVERAVAWQVRRLVFPGDRIADIVQEFNRYNRTQIRVEDDAIRGRRMSGVFDADDPAPLLQFLSRDPEIVVVKGEDEVLIRSRRSSDAAASAR